MQTAQGVRQLSEQVEQAAVRLDRWFDSNGWAGWDPFDVRENALYQRSTSGKLGRAPAYIVRRAETYAPVALRRALGIRRRIYPKGMGLAVAAYADLFAATGHEGYLAKAKQCAEWLENNTSDGFAGACWGYPFDWQSRILIPRGIPSSVVSAVVGDGFWRLYRVTGDERYLRVCQDITKFFLAHLRRTFQSDDAICFSYTPLDDFQVHNANLFVAEFLTRVGKETGDENLVEQGVRAGRFALREQNQDGALFYWGKAQESRYSPGGKPWIDHYHSGFEIRLLYGLWQNTRDSSFRKAYQAYYDFYRTTLYLEGGVPKYTPDSHYPVDIHSCAEAILCNATLLPEQAEALPLLQEVVPWTLENMEYQPGRYAYWLVQKRSKIIRVSIPFIRWGQSWMLRALSQALLQLAAIKQGTEQVATANQPASAKPFGERV